MGCVFNHGHAVDQYRRSIAGRVLMRIFFARSSTAARLGLSMRERVAVVCTESVQYLFDYFFGVRVFFERTGGARFFGVKIFIGGFSMILP
jgi:hypothetical protein